MQNYWSREHVVAACVGFILMSCGHAVLAEEKPAPKIDDLLQKRLAVVEDVRRALMQDLQAGGQLNWLELHEATVAVLNARLELAKSPNDRVKVYEDMLKTAEDLEDLCSKRSRTGNERQIVAQQAKALALEFQIALQRLKRTLHNRQPGA